MSISGISSQGVNSFLQGLKGSHKKHGQNGKPDTSDGSPFSLGVTQSDLSAIGSKVSQANPQIGAAIDKVAKNFSAIDTNGDGAINLNEFQTYLQQNGFDIPPVSQTSTSASSADPLASLPNAASTISTGVETSASSLLNSAIGKYTKAANGYTQNLASSLLGGVQA